MHREGFFSKVRAKKKHLKLLVVLSAGFLAICPEAFAQHVGDRSGDFEKYAMQLRETELLKINRHIIMSPSNPFSGENAFGSAGASSFAGRNGWKVNITTTVFWIGEKAAAGNPVPNDKSAWDGGWCSNYGGYDNPNPGARVNYIPINFLPRQNPFYVALPYNDVDNHHTKPEAAQVIPWFKSAFIRDGQSVCKGRWIAIRHGNRICYAQWEDVGPFTTDHWKYVFGNERPKPNRNHDAGLDVSPAVRDYLGIGGMDVCDWKFVNFAQIPPGPWSKYGDNNTFVRLRRQSVAAIASQRVPDNGSSIPR
jgi:hypothetical protein